MDVDCLWEDETKDPEVALEVCLGHQHCLTNQQLSEVSLRKYDNAAARKLGVTGKKREGNRTHITSCPGKIRLSGYS